MHTLNNTSDVTQHRNSNELAPGASAVSWDAILAGAAAAAALSLIMLILGTGLGLSSVSPWSREGISATTFGVSTILWVTFTQLTASGVGGYLAGRLRTRWIAVHSDEVYFRDTAHGFLAWAVASLATAALLTSVISTIVGAGVQGGATVAGRAATAALVATGDGAEPARPEAAKSDNSNGPMAYFVDALFRKDAIAPTSAGSARIAGEAVDQVTAAPAAEVARIFAQAIEAGALPAEDARYVGQMIARRTSLTPQDAEKRAVDTFERMQTQLRAAEATAKDVTDKTRKASAYSALWLFISLLIGAFVASLAATYGGRQRDL